MSDIGFRILDNSGRGVAQFGTFPDGNVALKIAKAGYEVRTATNDQLIFNSNQDIFKIVTTSTFNVADVTLNTITAGNVGLQTVTMSNNHNLGFIPAMIGFFQVNSQLFLLPHTEFALAGNNIGYGEVAFNLSASASQVTLDMRALTSALGSPANVTGTITGGTIFVYLLQETANAQ